MPEGLNDPTETRQRYQFDENELDILHDLVRRVQVDGWAGRPLLHGTVPTLVKVNSLPAASEGWGRAGPILLSGTPDKVYACLRNASGTWGWVQLDLAPLLDLDFLVGTATGALSAEIVAGTAPGGELGGTWGTPTVDATHSGSTHAATQAAAEATAAAYTDSEIGTHEAAGDPHPTYTTAAELASGIATHTADADAHHTPVAAAGWELIETGTFGNLGSELTTKTWSSLTYAAYRLTLYVNQITADDAVQVRLNGDSGSNYLDRLTGSASTQFTASASINSGDHGMMTIIVVKPQDSEEAMVYVDGIVVNVSSGLTPLNGNGGHWINTSAHVTSITVLESGGGKFGSNTFYVLEGQGTPI